MLYEVITTADNLKKHGGFIPGIRPGERTAEYIDYVLTRITVVGALYLAIVCLIPEILISYAAVPFYFGGTSLLIVVSVTMDTVAQIQGYLVITSYSIHYTKLYDALYIGLIVFFAFFYTAIVFNPTETADNLKKHGGFIPGIRPGERTRITSYNVCYTKLLRAPRIT